LAEVVDLMAGQHKTLSAWRDARRSEDFYTQVHSHYGAEIGL